MYKVCVDTGGTFTDCVVLDEENQLPQFKAPTMTTVIPVGGTCVVDALGNYIIIPKA
jgi:N-methylhydantoinase A/oxoprolinase/acetone carboxylase beta subunit